MTADEATADAATADAATVPRPGGPGPTDGSACEAAVDADGRRTPRPRRRWLVGGLALLVLVLVGGWLWVGLNPSVGTGPTTQVAPAVLDDEARIAELGLGFGEETAVVVDPDPGEAWIIHTYVNDGVLPVTVRVPGVPGVASSELMAYEVLRNDLAAVTEALVVAPGGGFALRTTVDWPRCTEWEDHSGTGPGVVTFDLTTLGLTRTVTRPLEPGLMIWTTVDLKTDCP